MGNSKNNICLGNSDDFCFKLDKKIHSTSHFQIYIFLCVLFASIMVLINLIMKKAVSLPIAQVYVFEIPAGGLLYPLMFMITDLVAEFYGKEKARFCVRLAIVTNIFIALILTGITSLPATSWSKVNNDLFKLVFGSYALVFAANMISCYLAQLVDISLYLWIKKLTKEKWLWLRNNGSTAISLFVDTFLAVNFFAFLDVFPYDKKWEVFRNAYAYKFFATICMTPLFYLLVFTIKKAISCSGLEETTTEEYS